MLTPRRLLLLAALLGAIGVAAGAFGAHALRTRLAPEALAIWQTGASYLFWHVLAALFAARQAQDGSRPARLAAVLFLGGTVVFSGTLFALALGAPRWLGAVTPLGGTALIAGWLALAWAQYRAPRQ
jgi:uncharacterized membrane protein YgdD (TMEM256/DUF423 family)